MMVIEISWPASRLMPNNAIGRTWQATHAAKSEYKQEAFAATLEAMKSGCCPGDACYVLKITFCAPDRRARDLDNLFAALKSALDGVAAALGVNDSRFVEYRLRRGAPVKGGKVVIEIEQIKSNEDGYDHSHSGDPDPGDGPDQD